MRKWDRGRKERWTEREGRRRGDNEEQTEEERGEIDRKERKNINAHKIK